MWSQDNHLKTGRFSKIHKSRNIKISTNMKKFIIENWYKLMIGSSMLMASFGLMIHSISPAFGDNTNNSWGSNYKLIPTNPDGSINVKFSPTETMLIDIRKVGGLPVCTWTKNNDGGEPSRGMWIKQMN